jgi:hypothetical protein
VRRLIPYFLLAVLVVWAGVFTLISYRQSRDPSSIELTDSCPNMRQIMTEPSTLVLSCADVNSEFTDLHWIGWGNNTAYASGEARWNDCTPTCVDGHWHTTAITLWTWDPRGGFYTKIGSSDPRLLGTQTLHVGSTSQTS